MNIWLVLLVIILVILLGALLCYIIGLGWNVHYPVGGKEYVGGAIESKKTTSDGTFITDALNTNKPCIILRDGWEYTIIPADEFLKELVVDTAGTQYDEKGLAQAAATATKNGTLLDTIQKSEWDMNKTIKYMKLGYYQILETEIGKLLGNTNYKEIDPANLNFSEQYGGIQNMKFVNAHILTKNIYTTEFGKGEFYSLTFKDVSNANQVVDFFKYFGKNNFVSYKPKLINKQLNDNDNLIFDEKDRLVKKISLDWPTILAAKFNKGCVNAFMGQLQHGDQGVITTVLATPVDKLSLLNDIFIENVKNHWFEGDFNNNNRFANMSKIPNIKSLIDFFKFQYNGNDNKGKKISKDLFVIDGSINGQDVITWSAPGTAANKSNGKISIRRLLDGLNNYINNNTGNLIPPDYICDGTTISVDDTITFYFATKSSTNIKDDIYNTLLFVLATDYVFYNFFLGNLKKFAGDFLGHTGNPVDLYPNNADGSSPDFYLHNNDDLLRNVVLIKDDVDCYEIKGNVYGYLINEGGLNFIVKTDIIGWYEVASKKCFGKNIYEWHKIKCAKINNAVDNFDADSTDFYILDIRHENRDKDKFLTAIYDKTGIPLGYYNTNKDDISGTYTTRNNILGYDYVSVVKATGVDIYEEAGHYYLMDNFNNKVKLDLEPIIDGNYNDTLMVLYSFNDGSDAVYGDYHESGFDVGRIKKRTLASLITGHKEADTFDDKYIGKPNNANDERNYFEKSNDIANEILKGFKGYIIRETTTANFYFISYDDMDKYSKIKERKIPREYNNKFYFWVLSSDRMTNNVDVYECDNKAIGDYLDTKKYNDYSHAIKGSKNHVSFVPIQARFNANKLTDIKLDKNKPEDIGFYFAVDGAVNISILPNTDYFLENDILSTQVHEYYLFVIDKIGGAANGTPGPDGTHNYWFMIKGSTVIDTLKKEGSFYKLISPIDSTTLSLDETGFENSKLIYETIFIDMFEKSNIDAKIWVFKCTERGTHKQYNITDDNIKNYSGKPALNVEFKKSIEEDRKDREIYYEQTAIESKDNVEEVYIPSVMDNIESKYSDEVQYDLCKEIESHVSESYSGMSLEECIIKEIAELDSLNEAISFISKVKENVREVEVEEVKPKKIKKSKVNQNATKKDKIVEMVNNSIDLSNPRIKLKMIRELRKRGLLKNLKLISDDDIRRILSNKK
jgi:hypothetical protein